MGKINQLLIRLQQNNDKAFYLAFLRVAVSLWMLKELLLRWKFFPVLFSDESFLQIAPAGTLRMFGLDPYMLEQHYLLIAWVCIALLVLNIFGIGRNVVSILLFLALTFFKSINDSYMNGGDKMALLLLFYLSPANTFSYFTLFKRRPLSMQKEKLYNLVTNLAAYSIIINLCLAYFFAGVLKLPDPLWQNGTAIHYFINDDRYFVFAAGGRHIEFPKLVLYIINYGTLFLEISFPALVWYKETRNITLFLCFLMHLGIYCFLMVYAFSVIFVLQYGMFYSNDAMIALYEKIKSPFAKFFGPGMK